MVLVGFDGPLLVVTDLCKAVFFSGTRGGGKVEVGGDGGSPSSLIFRGGSLDSKVRASKKEKSSFSPSFATPRRWEFMLRGANEQKTATWHSRGRGVDRAYK